MNNSSTIFEDITVTDCFPARYPILRKRYDERLSEIGRAALAAAKTHREDQMESVYSLVRETLVNASMGGVGKNERRLREHLAHELEGLCLAWQMSGEVVHDVADRLKLDEFVSENDAFADLQNGGGFSDLSYVHIGEGTGLTLGRSPAFFIDGFFIQPSCLGDEEGTMLTFACGIVAGSEPVDELGPLLRASGRTVIPAAFLLCRPRPLREVFRPGPKCPSIFPLHELEPSGTQKARHRLSFWAARTLKASATLRTGPQWKFFRYPGAQA